MPGASRGRLSWGSAVPFTWQWETVKRQSRISRKRSRLIHFIRKRGKSRACVWAAGMGNSRMVNHSRGVPADHCQRASWRWSRKWSCVWLACHHHTTLNDPSLGTIQDAKTYYEKCLKATMRRDELYGKRTKEELPPVLDILHRNFQQHPEAVNFQRDLQHIIQGMGGTFVEEKGGLETKFSCVTCGALQGSNGGIMKCSSRCRLVSYCSKDCQRAVSCFFIHVLYYLLLLLYTNFLFIIGNLISLSLFWKQNKGLEKPQGVLQARKE